MKHIIALVLFIAGVAATLSAFSQEVDPLFGWDYTDPLNPVPLNRIEDFQEYINRQRAEVENIESAAAKQKAQIQLLWEEAGNLVNGLKASIETLNQLVENYNAQDGFVGNKEFDEWIKEQLNKTVEDLNKKIEKKKDKDDDDDPTDLSDYAKKSDLTDYAKKSDLNDYAKESVLSDYAKKTELNDYAKKSDLSDYLKTSDAQSTYATKETTNNHETRITALENRPGGGGGGGCDDNCKGSWGNLASFFGEAANIDDAEDGGCGLLTFNGEAIDWLSMFFDDKTFTLGEGDKIGLKVEASDGNLADALDSGESEGRLLVMGEEGGLSTIEIGKLELSGGSIAVQGTTGGGFVDGNRIVFKGPSNEEEGYGNSDVMVQREVFGGNTNIVIRIEAVFR